MADDENNASLCDADSATGLTACLVSEEDEAQATTRVHESSGGYDIDYGPEEDRSSQDEDDDVADDQGGTCLESKCYHRNRTSNAISQRKRPRDSDGKAAYTLPDTIPDSVVVARDRTRADSCDQGASVVEPVFIDRVPRQRRSETWSQRIDIIKSVEHVSNLLPPFPLQESNDWDSILEAAKSYTEENHLRYRWRDSRLTETHNKTSEVKLPIKFKWVFRVYRCTHGCYSKPRGKGKRQKVVRFQGCPARFTARVENSSDGWKIVIKNETRTHNHEVNSDIASTYLGAASADNHPEVLNTLAEMVHARAEPRCITSFLTNKLGRPVTPQQARNIVRRLEGQTDAQEKLKILMNAVAQEEGSDVLFLQDQMDITTGIVFQTKQQKESFELWGDCLVMDWTHGTNNLGYHLGSLIVTTSTGRGVPVIDFLSLDEKAITMDKIFAFFKSKNPRWQEVKSFVIDKDFVEWRVIETCFPRAKVLLCQYHAITSWRKLLARRSKANHSSGPPFNLTVVQRDDLESMFARMLNSNSEATFDECYEAFRDYCNKNASGVRAYFDKNWKSCTDMWATFARDRYFSAGNSTTNRIEANWHQVKKLLGNRPRLDKAVGGLLGHQRAVFRNLNYALNKHGSTSRRANSVSEFLQPIASRMSDYTYQLLRNEWDVLHSGMKDAGCVQFGSKCEWEVYTNYRRYNCDVEKWSCSCNFHTSTHLPCRHLLLIVRDGLKLPSIPTQALRGRWCMRAAREMRSSLHEGCATLSRILDFVRLPPCASVNTSVPLASAPLSDQLPLTYKTPLSTPRRVSYVKLRRGEEANMVVLSSNEKYRYALATLEPVLNTLSQLSTVEFFQRLSHLEAAANDFSRQYLDHNAEPAAEDLRPQEGSGEEGCSDDEYAFDVEMPEMIRALTENNVFEDQQQAEQGENQCDGSTITQSFGSTICIPDRTSETASLTAASNKVPVSTCNVSTPGISEPAGAASTDLRSPDARLVVPKRHQLVNSVQPSIATISGVEVLRLPKPRPKKQTRKAPKQAKLWATRPNRLAVMVLSESTVKLRDLIVWSECVEDLELVKTAMDAYPVSMTDKFLEGREPIATHEKTTAALFDYNFVVPRALVKTMERVIRTQREKSERSARLQRRHERTETSPRTQGATDPVDIVLSYGGDLKKFSSISVFRMVHFYSIKMKLEAWQEDRQWLMKNWDNEIQVDLFNIEASDEGNRNDLCAKEVLLKYRTCSLKTQFTLPSQNVSVKFDQVVGDIARNGLLNDAIINMCLQQVCDLRHGCKLLNCQVNMVGWPATPRSRTMTDEVAIEDITKIKWLILPMNIANNHWVMIAAKICYEGAITAFFYDPLNKSQIEMEDEWENGMLPFLTQWHDDFNLEIAKWNTTARKADEPVRYQLSFPSTKKKWLSKPKQPDGWSCGVLVIAQAYTLLSNQVGLRKVTREQVRVLRLRILWFITCYCYGKHPPPQRFENCRQTDELLKSFLNKEKPANTK